MAPLERALVRFLTDPEYLAAFKQGKVNPSDDFGLTESEKQLLDTTMSVGDGVMLDAMVDAAQNVRSQAGTATPADLSSAIGVLERVVLNLERVAPKLERVAPKLEKVAPKLERVEPKVDHLISELEEEDADDEPRTGS